jgi:hypothetical protein
MSVTCPAVWKVTPDDVLPFPGKGFEFLDAEPTIEKPRAEAPFGL